MMHEKKMGYIVAVAKNVLLFGMLFVITLLLLALPQKLFEKSDVKLLEEKGKSAYELKAVENDMLLFSEKLKMFVDGEPIREFTWTENFDENDIILEEVALAVEIDLLLDGMYKFTTDQLREGKFTSKGFATEVCCDIEKTEYKWTVGLLTFESEDFTYDGSVIYDYDSKKIFYLELSDRNMSEYDSWEGENLWLESVVEYYEGLDVQWVEATVRLEPRVIIFPAYLEAFQSDVLYWNLIKAYDKLLAEDVSQEVPIGEWEIFND